VGVLEHVRLEGPRVDVLVGPDARKLEGTGLTPDQAFPRDREQLPFNRSKAVRLRLSTAKRRMRTPATISSPSGSPFFPQSSRKLREHVVSASTA
jgi:hypothetical protein